MKLSTRTIALTAALALSAAPAVALPAQIPSNQGTAHIPDNQGTQQADNPGPPANQGTANMPENPGQPASQGTSNRPATPGPNASAKSKGKAYGKYCADQSKKHVDGQQGTPFSKCVTAMAKLATGQTSNPATACKTESKKRLPGQKGTPFSKCVSAGAKLLGDQEDEPAA
jgi:hypothetical protein